MVDISKYKNKLKEIGDIINKYNMRVDLHLDPYYVLNSIRSEVIESTINILNFYQIMVAYMNVDYKIVTHVGGKTLGKKEGIKRFKDNFNLLNEELKKRIIVENDDKVYNIRNVLKICNDLKIPMVLDYHHFICNRNNEKIENYIEKIFSTWSDVPKIHFSSPKNKKEKRAHNDYIDIKQFICFIEKIKFINQDFDIMIEAKAKDEALFRLIRQLKYYGYKTYKTTLIL